MPSVPTRLVALGASNLTRGLATVVAQARGAWGPEVEIVAALGLGRSYGAPSRVFLRGLPGILECGLWSALEALPPAPTRALITDVGNDILYQFPVGQILSWLTETVDRLRRLTDDIVITGLPLDTMRALSPAKFVVARSLLVPSCRLSFVEVAERAEAVDAGLAALAASFGLRFVPLERQWYGFDPVHFRHTAWRTCWSTIAGTHEEGAAARLPWPEWVRLYSHWPEVQHVAGLRHATPQTGRRLAGGGRVWLY